MSDVEFEPPTPPDSFRGYVTAIDQSIGMALCSSSSAVPEEVIPARANATGTSDVVGFATRETRDLGQVQYPKYGGLLQLTAAQWAVVTEEAAALTEGAAYYLSAANAGKITETAPVAAGSFVTKVGIALSTTTLLIQIGTKVGPHG